MFLEPASPGSPSPFAFRVAPDPLEAAVREACQELVRLAAGDTPASGLAAPDDTGSAAPNPTPSRPARLRRSDNRCADG